MQTTTPTTRTGPEILELKCGWLRDNCWDIEETEGFEAHRDELLAFRLQCEAEWKAKLQSRAAELGCTVALVQYLEGLEYQIKALDRKLERYSDPF